MVPINKEWSWSNQADYMFGDSEGGFNLKTAINWKPFENWIFNASIRYEDLEYDYVAEREVRLQSVAEVFARWGRSARRRRADLHGSRKRAGRYGCRRRCWLERARRYARV